MALIFVVQACMPFVVGILIPPRSTADILVLTYQNDVADVPRVHCHD